MRRYARYLLAQALLLGLIPGFSTAQGVSCPTVEAPEVAFDQPIYIDTQRAGGEPVSIVAQDGSISVSAHAGTTHVYKNPNAAPGAGDFLVGYTNQTLHWRSTDGGRTWRYIGFAGQREGPHTASSTGFSDPDLAIDAGGRIYDVEIDLANDAVFSSVDDGQSYTLGNPMAAPGDRPWLTGGRADEVYLYVNSLPKSLSVSRDGGITFTPLPVPPVTSKSLMDPTDPTLSTLIGPVGLGSFAISKNRGQSWEEYDLGPLGSATQFFGVLGVDKAGNIYQAAAGGYNGSNDSNANGEVTFAYYERATGNTNNQKVRIPTPDGDALWPWIMAGDDGRVAVVWYQSLKGKPTEFYTYLAYTHNGHGTTVTCSDGSTKFIEPRFTVVNASGRPVHSGFICLDGTTCNANLNFESGDRRLGDFFTVNFDKDGNLFIVSADTMLKNPVGGPKPVGNPIFIRQTAGDKMLATPMPTRKTRCLYPLPTC